MRDDPDEHPPDKEAHRQDAERVLEREAIDRRLRLIDHVVIVLSGKGGVGKSMVAVNLADTMAIEGKQVGLLDVDIHGPSVPQMLGIADSRPTTSKNTIVPVSVRDNFRVISIAFFLPRRHDAVIWRGPLKMGLIKQFIKDVEWGQLDYLVVDIPPGTGDEPLSVCQLIPRIDGAIIVTTPQEIAILDVSKSITFCKQLNVPVAGVLENMARFVCPHCHRESLLFRSGGGKRVADEAGVPFLESLPFDPRMVEANDRGESYCRAYPDAEISRAFRTVAKEIESFHQRRASRRRASVPTAHNTEEGSNADL